MERTPSAPEVPTESADSGTSSTNAALERPSEEENGNARENGNVRESESPEQAPNVGSKRKADSADVPKTARKRKERRVDPTDSAVVPDEGAVVPEPEAADGPRRGARVRTGNTRYSTEEYVYQKRGRRK